MQIKPKFNLTFILLYLTSSISIFSQNDCSFVTSSSNFVKNPSFETATGGVSNANWAATNGSITSNTSWKGCGNRGIYLTHNSGIASVLQRINIGADLRVGSNFTFSAYAGTHEPAMQILLVVKFYKADNTEAATALTKPVTRDVDVAPVNQLELYSIDGTIPANTAYIQVGGTINDDYLKLDGVGLRVVAAPLPVTLLKFAGNVLKNSVELNWKTSQEKDFSHFEVQKSSNSIEFGAVAQITGNNVSNYNYLDTAPELGTNYYRLKMVDIDGSSSFSNIISVKYDLDENFALFENPIKGSEIIINTNAKEPLFKINAASGLQMNVFTQKTDANTYSIRLENGQPGLYFLSIISKEKVITKKILVI